MNERIKMADHFESKAKKAKSTGNTSQANTLLMKAVAATDDATRMADNWMRLREILSTLGSILIVNKQWNTDCKFVNDQLIAVTERYNAIAADRLDVDIDEAWADIIRLQPDVASLVASNQTSREIADNLAKLRVLETGLDTSLKNHPDFNQYASIVARIRDHYQTGKWELIPNAEIEAASAALNRFLAKHEPAELRKKRLENNVDLLNEQLAQQQHLNQQLKSLQTQIRETQAQNAGLALQGEQLLRQRDAARNKLESATDELKTARETLATQVKEISSLQSERNELSKWQEEKTLLLSDYQRRLDQGSKAYRDQEKKLKLANDIIAQIRANPNSTAQSAQSLAKIAAARQSAEEAAVKYQPDSLEDASERLVKETQQYETLLRTLATVSKGKRDRHPEVVAAKANLDSQYRIVISPLRKRDQQAALAWDALEAQIQLQNIKRKQALEIWLENDPDSIVTKEIDPAIRNLTNQQKPHISGRSRFTGDNYDFADWDSLKQIPELKFAIVNTVFRQLKLGSQFTNTIGQKLIFLPAGTFQMGSPSNENSQTQHQVTLTKGYFLASTETTQRAWQSVMNSEPWREQSYVREGDSYPAVYVSAEEADQFCERLNALERQNGTLPPGWEYRLPTEAQWEYACRAGSTTAYHFGNNDEQHGQYAWFDENAWHSDQKYAHAVGTKRANQWGLFDMHGNVWEWTSDVYKEYPRSSVTDPWVINGGSFRVYRGGSFNYASSYCRSVLRLRNSPGYRYFNLGFRVACVQLNSK